MVAVVLAGLVAVFAAVACVVRGLGVALGADFALLVEAFLTLVVFGADAAFAVDFVVDLAFGFVDAVLVAAAVAGAVVPKIVVGGFGFAAGSIKTTSLFSLGADPVDGFAPAIVGLYPQTTLRFRVMRGTHVTFPSTPARI